MRKFLSLLSLALFSQMTLMAQANGDTFSTDTFTVDNNRAIKAYISADNGIVMPIAGGSTSAFFAIKFLSNGEERDTAYGNDQNFEGMATMFFPNPIIAQFSATELSLNDEAMGAGRYLVQGVPGNVFYVQALARFRADGQLDSTLSMSAGGGTLYGVKTFTIDGAQANPSSADNYVYALTTAATINTTNNAVVVAGTFNTGTSTTPSMQRKAFVRVMTETLGNVWQFDLPVGDAAVMDAFHSVAVQSNGRILAAGERDGEAIVVRLTTSGALDAAFNTTGEHTFSQFATFDVVKLQADGKAVLAARNGTNFSIIRLGIDGSLDNTFGTNGIANFSLGATLGSNSISDISFHPTTGKIALAIRNDEGKYAFLYLNTDGTASNFFADASLSGVRIFQNGTLTTEMGLSGAAFQSTGALVTFGHNNAQSLGYLNRYALDVSGIAVERLQAAQNLHLFPNPVRGATTLTYNLPTAQNVSLSLVDLTGKTLTRFFEGVERQAGQQQEFLQMPADLPAGQYFLLFETQTERSAVAISIAP